MLFRDCFEPRFRKPPELVVVLSQPTAVPPVRGCLAVAYRPVETSVVRPLPEVAQPDPAFPEPPAFDLRGGLPGQTPVLRRLSSILQRVPFELQQVARFYQTSL